MLDVSTLALFAAACLALTMTPGPDMLLILSRSVTQGRRSGFATLAGIQAGTYCHALAAAFGLSQLFLAVPFAYDAVRYAGAAYLLFLAYKAFRTHGTAMAPAAGLPRYPAGCSVKAWSPTCSIPRWRCSCWPCSHSSSVLAKARSRCRSWCWQLCST